MGALGLVRVFNNTELAAMEQRQRVDAQQNQPFYIGLAGHIQRFWQSAYTAKRSIEVQLLKNLRQRQGVYEAADLAAIREQGGSEIFMMLTAAKCNGAEAWLREILCTETDKPWGLEPTPMPDLPPYVQQAIVEAIALEALAAGWELDDGRLDERLLTVKNLAYQRLRSLSEKIAERMENTIADQFAEGGWHLAVSDFIYNYVTFPAAFIKGPIFRNVPTRQWVPGPQGTWVSRVQRAVRPEWEAPSPFDMYPAAGMRNIQRGNLIQRYRYTREDLQTLIDAPGYSNDAIYQVLDDYGMKGFNSHQMIDLERAALEGRPNEQYDPEGMIEALNFWGSAPGYLIREWAFSNKVPLDQEIDPHKEYQIEAWQIGSYTIKAQLNPDPLGEKPYGKACFEEVPGAFWGQGLPEKIADCQRMCNAAARAISNNAGIASGPQVDISVDRIADGESITKPYPWKLWQTVSDPTGTNTPAVRFFQPQMNVQELIGIYTHFERVADNSSGFPNYTYGDAKVGGAGRTASGLNQLMGNVEKGVRFKVYNIDIRVISFHVARMFDYNMEYHPDQSIKGDVRVVAKGSAAMLMKDVISMRQKEMLQATLNPFDAQILGARGRAEMLRPALKAAEFPVDKILPNELELQLAMASMPPPSQLLGKTGPNAAASPSGQQAPGEGQPNGQAPDGGGSPQGAANIDNGGQPVQGGDMRQASQGYADGGYVSAGHSSDQPTRPKRRFQFHRMADGGLVAEEIE